MSIALDILRPKSTELYSPKGGTRPQSAHDRGADGATNDRPFTSPAGTRPVSQHIVLDSKIKKTRNSRKKERATRAVRERSMPPVSILKPSSLPRTPTPSEQLLPLPSFKPPNVAAEPQGREEMNVTLDNYRWQTPLGSPTHTFQDGDVLPGILRTTPVRAHRPLPDAHKWERLSRRVSFQSNFPKNFKLKKRPAVPLKPSLVTRIPSSFTVKWKLPSLYTKRGENSDDDDEFSADDGSDSDDSERRRKNTLREPKRFGFEFHVAGSVADLNLGGGIRRCFSAGYHPRIVVRDIAPDRVYYVRVRTQYTDGWSPFSNTLRVPKFSPSAPGTPDVNIVTYPQEIIIRYNFDSGGRDGYKAIEEHEFRVRNKRTGDVVYEYTGEPNFQPQHGERKGEFVVNDSMGVDDRTSYMVEARAKNSLGWGEVALTRAVTQIRDGPYAPEIMSITDVHCNGATVKVRSSLGKTKLPILGFQIIVSYDGGITSHTRVDFSGFHQTGLEGLHTLRIVDQLLPSRTTLLRVRAKNKVAYSKSSTYSKIDTLAAKRPAAMHPVTVKVLDTPNLGTFSACISWTKLQSFGAKLLKQELKVEEVPLYRPRDMRVKRRTTIIPIGHAAQTCTIDDLWPSSTYEIKLRGLSEAGWGPWKGAPAVVVTTPKLDLKHLFVYFFWEGPWMRQPGWYKGRLVGDPDAAKCAKYVKIESMDYPGTALDVPSNRIAWTQDIGSKMVPMKNPYNSNLSEAVGKPVDRLDSSDDDSETDESSVEENSDDEAFAAMYNNNFNPQPGIKKIETATLVDALVQSSKAIVTERKATDRYAVKREQRRNFRNYWW
jgi:hypothetical protein